jgi:hypothetical protein
MARIVDIGMRRKSSTTTWRKSKRNPSEVTDEIKRWLQGFCCAFCAAERQNGQRADVLFLVQGPPGEVSPQVIASCPRCARNFLNSIPEVPSTRESN